MADSKLRKDNYDIEVRKWENEALKIKLWMIRINKEFFFFGKELASELEYRDPKKTIQNRVSPEEKRRIDDLLGKDYKKILEKSLNSTGDKISLVEFFQKLKSNQNLLTEFGLYAFCGESKKEKAKPFQRWIFNTIKEIRITGSYSLPGGPTNNPLDLIAKVSSFEKEIKSLKKEIHTLKDQKVKSYRERVKTSKNTKIIKDYLRKLKREIEKIENELERSLEKTSSSDSDSSYNSLERESNSDSD